MTSIMKKLNGNKCIHFKITKRRFRSWQCNAKIEKCELQNGQTLWTYLYLNYSNSFGRYKCKLYLILMDKLHPICGGELKTFFVSLWALVRSQIILFVLIYGSWKQETVQSVQEYILQYKCDMIFIWKHRL